MGYGAGEWRAVGHLLVPRFTPHKASLRIGRIPVCCVGTVEAEPCTPPPLHCIAVKYADLKNHRTTNYRFSYDDMLSQQVGLACLLGSWLPPLGWAGRHA